MGSLTLEDGYRVKVINRGKEEVINLIYQNFQSADR